MLSKRVRTDKAQETKEKNKTDFEVKNLCEWKDANKKVRRPPTEGEKVFANHLSDKDLVSRTYKELLQQRDKQVIKMGKEFESPFLQKRHANGQKAHD